jgi:hypothetical protein
MQSLFVHPAKTPAGKHTALLLILCYWVLYGLINFLTARFVLTDSIYVQSFGEQLTFDRISRLIEQRKKWEWLSYVLFLLVILVKIYYASACIFIAALLGNFDIRWKDILRVVTICEIVFILASVTRLGFFLIDPPADMQTISNFAPFSISMLLGPGIPNYLLYATQTVNLFELAYCLMLAAGLMYYSKKPFGFCLSWVARSYLPGLLIWIVFVTFLSVQFQ